jgi:hypothetical protein
VRLTIQNVITAVSNLSKLYRKHKHLPQLQQ